MATLCLGGMVSAQPLVNPALTEDFSISQISPGAVGQIGQMTFGLDGRLYVAATGQDGTAGAGGIFRFDYDPNGMLTNGVEVSTIASTGIAFHADTVSGNTYMYITDVPNIFEPASPAAGVMRRMTDTNNDGTWGGAGDINQIVVNNVPIVGQHRMNQLQVRGDSLYTGIGTLTSDGTNESAYNGTISFINDLTLLTDTATANVAGLAGPFVAGGNPNNNDTPYTSTDDGKLRVHSSGLRNPYGIAFDGNGDLWVSNNQSQPNPTPNDELFIASEFADYGFNSQIGGAEWSDDADVIAAGFFDAGNLTTSVTADGTDPSGLGAHAAVGGFDFYNGVNEDWDGFLFIPRWVNQDLLAVDPETGDITSIITALNRPLDVLADANGNLLIAEANNNGSGVIYRLVVVPEPATIMILGLGGLLLLKRNITLK